MTFSTAKYDNQPTCYNCHAKGHFRSQCPKLVTVGTSKTPQKPVALLVWLDQGREERLLAPSVSERKKVLDGPELDCEEGVQAASLVPPPVDASVTPADSELGAQLRLAGASIQSLFCETLVHNSLCAAMSPWVR